MNNQIRAQRLAELLGMEVPTEFVAPPDVEIRNYEQEAKSREAEAVLAYVDDSRKFIQRECSNCGYTFAVNRANVNKCSDHCRKIELEKIGITWDASKNPAERWDFREPLVVPPQVLPHLLKIEGQRQQQLQGTPEGQNLVLVESAEDYDGLLADLGID